ncbi:MAG: acyltransferase domain-containing protein [Anaerolineae bacterium]|nr:acyltransferase domain-containing protein [Anaerolineae bacterium]
MSEQELSPLKRALLELREMRTRLDELEAARGEPIAVIGMGMRFPGGVDSPDAYWELLKNGVDAIRDIPSDRWSTEAYYDPDPNAPGKMYARAGGFIDDVDKFDPAFFGISPREAVSMDPQQRILLQVAWEALERAGQAPDKLLGSPTSVFIGIANDDYGRKIWSDTENIDVYFATGNTLSVASGRLSYLLGLQGPSLSIDTACSSSLVAVHLAAQSLRSGESRMAIAGGVNLILAPEAHINFSKSQMMAFDDHCKTFDADADGYVRGEGCGVVVLKRLSDALADGDPILAVVLGSAVNQDGKSNGLTAPNGPSQEAVLRAALENAGIESGLVSYIEAHGTGTPLGDPIEVNALAASLGEGHSKENPLRIGSAKTNIGHLESAAGVAGLMKVVLMLQHCQIPPHLHLKMLNPYIPWDEIPLEVTTTLSPFPAQDGRSIAGVSSFGFSGTNAHVILEAAPETEVQSSETERPLHLLAFSARRDTALVDLAKQYIQLLAVPSASLPDIGFTANAGRAHLTHRLALAAENVAEAREKLLAFIDGQETSGLVTNVLADTQSPEITFMFTGHGAQYAGMGRTLYEAQPVFRAAIDECAEILKAYLEYPLYAVLFPEGDTPDLMRQMLYAQPALFALEYALAKLWMSWGIRPAMVMGHSVGEYAAACIAGLFSVNDGLKLVFTRGRLFDSLPEPGEMVAVFADEATVAPLVAPYSDKVSIAAINGPGSVVISGATSTVEVVVAQLKEQGIKSRKLDVPQSSHSPLLEPILDEFERIANEIEYHPPQIGLVSGVSGEIATFAEVGNGAYWRRHLRQPVQFMGVMQTLHREGYRVFVEIGSSPTLLGMGRRCLPNDYGVWLPSLRKDWNDWAQMLESLAGLYVQGADVDWRAFDQDYNRQIVTDLPTYPWAKERYWYESGVEQTAVHKTDSLALWNAMVDAGVQQAANGPLDLNLPSYPAKWAALERLTTAYIVTALRDLKIFSRMGERYTVDELLSQFNISTTFHSLLTRWLGRLVDEGLLTREGESFASIQPLSEPGLADALAETEGMMADSLPLLDYIRRCGDHLAAILNGTYSPLETIFPGGSLETARYMYNGWAPVRYFNAIARSALQAAVSRINGTVRVLEIGAGTGGTAAAVVPIFPADRTTYAYTDVSDFFLGHAQERFSDYPFVQYGLLNAEQDPTEQGYAPGSFDIILSANALHATRNLGQTLDHVRSLLAPNGLLMLYETTEHLGYYDITTGLIEGWGIFEDELRGDNPLLPPMGWQSALAEHGFEQVVIFPEAGAATEIFGQHIIVARASADGEPAQGLNISITQTDYTHAESTPESQTAGFMVELTALLPDDRNEALTTFVRERVARTLRLPVSHPIDRRSRLMDLGVDSLMAVELRNRLETGLGISGVLPATLIFDYPTVDAIVAYIESGVFAPSEVEPDVETQSSTEQPTTDLEGLSDDEVAALLMRKLGDL